MIGSVRGRLTFAVATVVGAVAVAAALVAPRSVERSLIDDRLDAEVPVEQAALDSRLVTITIPHDPIGSPELTALFGPDLANLVAGLDDAGALDELRAFRSDGSLVVSPVAGVVGVIDSDGRIRVDGRAVTHEDGPVVTGSRLEQLSTDLNPPSVFETPYDIFSGGNESLERFLDELDARFDRELGGRLDLGDLGEFGDFDDLSKLAEQVFSEEWFRTIDPGVLDQLPDSPVPPTPVRSVDQLVFGTRSVGGIDVIVAAPTDGIDRTVERLRTALWVAVPIAMLLTGMVTWLLAGRALRPVRAITDRTGRIRAGTLHERVPVPSANDEIAGLAIEMNDMLDRLEREDRRRRQFVADASHELRSPIASIHTQAEVALAASDEIGTAELAGGVLAEAERLGTIVDDLLALARHDEALAPPGAIVDLDDIVLAVADRTRRIAVDTSGVSGGQVRGHADELSRVVTHLLDNAARHARSTVRVAVETVGGDVRLRVDDDGPGVPPDDRRRVFDRFVRLDEARVRDDGGAGLGLAVVDSVVTAAGGSIDVTDSDLGGARFEIRLPAAR